jgi:hypothetical protein
VPTWMQPFPWNWLSDPWWIIAGNVLFWPAIFGHAWVMDKWDETRRVRSRRLAAD